jgi:hypothetical protein
MVLEDGTDKDLEKKPMPSLSRPYTTVSLRESGDCGPEMTDEFSLRSIIASVVRFTTQFVLNI